MKILILAGGSGKRLWPLISPPKQFRCFGSLDSLIQLTLKRFLRRYPPKDIHILTTAEHAQLARAQATAVHTELASQLIIEPQPQSTAPAIAHALETLGHTIGDHFLLTPSDHFIDSSTNLLNAIQRAEGSHKAGVHTLFGIAPSCPHTGYGYIQHSSGYVTRFVEKPPRPLAELLLAQGCMWNSGIALFDTQALRDQLPKEPPSISIDHLIFEKAQNLRALPLNVEWSDLGTWEGIYSAFPKDAKGNVIFGRATLDAVEDCLVIANGPPIQITSHRNEAIITSDDAQQIVMPLHTPFPLHC